MTDQPALFDAQMTPYGVSYGQHPAVTTPQHEDDLDARFDAWLSANGHVLDAFCARALAYLRAGRDRYGAKKIAEEMRWDSGIRANGDSYKVNNSFISPMVAEAKKRYPELRDFFEQRKTRS